uniref:Inorganic triphosphatase YgiF, contains CYTH and CHAD domains n=1 Tax=Candidatus Kentrum sp. FM TaxID=2126340 RepID=A0A450TE01_9GAMM|nr:MAG: Inorganic triphosphatase YgiF, contains CYTH and CHAD domains [Candidatus Kentron sp. FM]VFJ65189.1 MAG: Inorganic triphosphatase YgiF, contains CYTH and CHAD domains [Candidatus Kentron sp. FM]VFK15650.1 MAG: Inorganic triphosphatase YgiF, contains CYTH and CHAD domains [Candidatus Kentron sp. FM]
MPIETELKLRFLIPEDTAKLPAHPLLANAGPGTREQLTATYYDTPARELLRSGIALRVRRENGRLLQTVKTANTSLGGLHQRQEWEQEVQEEDVLKNGPVLDRLPKVLRKTLGKEKSNKRLSKHIAPCFTTDFKRTQWILPLGILPLGSRTTDTPPGTRQRSADSSQDDHGPNVRRAVPAHEKHADAGHAGEGYVEVCLDEGEIRNGKRTVALHEVELELKGGDNPAPLYEMALQLQQTLPLVVENASKAQRGYELDDEPGRHGSNAFPAPKPQKARAITLDPKMSAEMAFVHIMNNCYAGIQANEAAVLLGADPEGVHRMRVGLRRMRACLALFKPLIQDDDSRELSAELRWIAGILGHARDWDVFAETLDGIAARITVCTQEAATRDSSVLESLRTETGGRRERYYRELREALGSVRYSRLLLGLGAWLNGRGWRARLDPDARRALARPAIRFSTKALEKQYKRVAKSGESLLRLSPAECHQVRIESKKLAYGVHFFRSLYSDKALVGAYVKSLSRLRDKLGVLNDAAMARALQDEAELSGDDPARCFLQGWYAAEMVDGLHGADKAWEGFLRQRCFW